MQNRAGKERGRRRRCGEVAAPYAAGRRLVRTQPGPPGSPPAASAARPPRQAGCAQRSAPVLTCNRLWWCKTPRCASWHRSCRTSATGRSPSPGQPGRERGESDCFDYVPGQVPEPTGCPAQGKGLPALSATLGAQPAVPPRRAAQQTWPGQGLCGKQGGETGGQPAAQALQSAQQPHRIPCCKVGPQVFGDDAPGLQLGGGQGGRAV